MGDGDHVLDHGAPTYWCIFSPSSEMVALISNKTISIWNYQTGDKITTVRYAIHDRVRHDHGYNYSSLFHSHDKPKPVRIHSATNTMEIWDLFTGSCVHNLHVKYAIPGAPMIYDIYTLFGAISPDGIHVAVGVQDTASNIRLDIRNVNTDTCVRTIHRVYHRGWMRGGCCCYSLDGSLLVSSYVNHDTVRVWNPDDGTCVCALRGHGGDVHNTIFSPRDTTLIATTSSDKTVKLWHARTGVCLDTLIGHTGTVYKCVFNLDGVYLASISSDGTTRIWDVYTGTCVYMMQHAGRHELGDFSFDSSVFGLATFDDSVCSPVCVVAGIQDHIKTKIQPLPARLRNNVKLLQLMLVGNRRCHSYLWLPTELWDWINIQWFFYY